MKKCILFLILLGIASGCSAVSSQGEHNHEQVSAPHSVDSQAEEVEKLVVQRGHDRFVFENPSRCMGILVNAKDLYRFAYRRDGEELGDEQKLPFLQEKLEEGTSQYDKVYIRIVQKPFIPESGVNEFPRKDIVIYLDPQNPNDAFVGVQNPHNLDEWKIYQVKDYGGWVKKEIDLHLALHTGL
ncbi:MULTISPECIES: hypothetical protein [Bacillales]|jgi:hypothetical protein|uniref:Lipoprotein n=1 Tax=Brevibacillus aydinogluensis TaxID=927786 RepID=A0AA48M402_9BACL|nr:MULTISPECIES: hypothetical protein [Bacillales]MBR8659784.1 hypothetical protein [Brevibacillus sp. NL20B1]NNV01232.1 hypothetical protein [Brevibacillus sp. MCWH]UFJ62064.1 hypothetical protein IRT44_04350 [Anoxybacillus sediminis]CAJ1000882.1 Lipoprotein [Brevibacillus aydinogluensis]